MANSNYKRRVFDAEDDLFQARCINHALQQISERRDLDRDFANMLSVLVFLQGDYITSAEGILYRGGG